MCRWRYVKLHGEGIRLGQYSYRYQAFWFILDEWVSESKPLTLTFVWQPNGTFCNSPPLWRTKFMSRLWAKAWIPVNYSHSRVSILMFEHRVNLGWFISQIKWYICLLLWTMTGKNTVEVTSLIWYHFNKVLHPFKHSDVAKFTYKHRRIITYYSMCMLQSIISRFAIASLI